MIQFTQPIFLWALTALAVPIGIHLLSRKEGKVIKMGSLRHLRETSTQQFKGIKLNEILLLALRCLLIILFVGMLAGFQWSSNHAKKWVLVEPGLENHSQVKEVMDSLETDGFERRWLQRGFPLQHSQQANEENYWRVIDDLKNEHAAQVIVFSRSVMKNFATMRPELDSTITWISIPVEPNDFVLQALKINEDQFLVRKGNATTEKISLSTAQISVLPDSVVAEPIRQSKILLVSDESHTSDALIIKASLDAIQRTLPIEFKIQHSKNLETGNDWVFWLSDEVMPMNDSVNLLVLKPQTSTQLISQEKSNQWTINKRLTVDLARTENLSLQLAELMIVDPKLIAKIKQHDIRVLPDSVISSGSRKNDSVLKAGLLASAPNKYLVILFLLILATERTIAYARKQ